jgi:hypothetical protein
MWKTNQFETAAALVAWLNTAAKTVAMVKFVYFDGASGRHVVVYFE